MPEFDPTSSEFALASIFDASTQLKAMQRLLEQLDDGNNNGQAVKDLHQLAERLAQRKSGSEQLSLRSVSLPGSSVPIRLIVHPAVFSPEHWGRTFAEGLLKNPEEFDGKSVVELGTGSGWISLMLLMRTGASSVLALDINPIAVVCARLNLWLNGTTADGGIVLTQQGIPLVSAMQVKESDLLSEPLSYGALFDRVVGCIPQVLHPDLTEPEVAQATTAALYDLSNYCFRQGILEDRYGLPLIARALEEGQLCLAPAGKITMILGGRPGPEAIISMFRRRGFEPQLIWSRRISQADDTDLASLVKLERLHDIKFHFFVSRDSEQAVCADTAVRLLAHGEPVYHDLLVFRASTVFEKSTSEFVRNLHKLQLDSLRQELDFSKMGEEQISYLCRLTADMLGKKAIPYPHERGDLSLRSRLSRFLKIYCHYSIEAEELFISGKREDLLKMVLNLACERGGQVLLSESLHHTYRSAIEALGFEVIESNDDLTEIFVLDDLLAPKVLTIAPQQLASPSRIALAALARQAERHPERWYLIDDSANFDISSDLNSNMLVRLLAESEMPSNVVLLYGLVKNVVQPDLELSFMLNAPAHWLDALDIGAELTYSRIAYPCQHYYQWLFDDLLSFTFANDDLNARKCAHDAVSRVPDLTLALAADPVFAPKPISLDTPDLIRLDYGEFAHAVPDVLVKGLIRGFLEDSSTPLLPIMLERVSEYLRVTRRACVEAEQIVLSQGVFPLFGALIGAMKSRLRRAPLVAVPTGSYGPVYPLVKYHGGELIELNTFADSGFLLDARFKFDEKPDLLWLIQPANPSGLFMDSQTVGSLLSYCAENGIYVLADEIFFLLSDVGMGKQTSSELSFASKLGSDESRFLFVADGIAKSFAAGGMRCGFLSCPDQAWRDEIQHDLALPPQSSLRAWDSLYYEFLEGVNSTGATEAAGSSAVAYLQDARALLSCQRNDLLALLRHYDVDDRKKNVDRGGLFVLAQIDDLVEILATEQHLLVNSGAWARIPGWSRLCIGLQPERFDVALSRLKKCLAGHRRR